MLNISSFLNKKEPKISREYQLALIAYLDKDGNVFVDTFGDHSTAKLAHLISSILVSLRQTSKEAGLTEEEFWKSLKKMADFCEENSRSR